MRPSDSRPQNNQQCNNGKWLWYYRALESVSIASALSSATIYPCQIRVHQRWQSKLKLPTARKEWWPATADSLPQAVTCQLWYTLLQQASNTQPSDCWSEALPVVPPTQQCVSQIRRRCAVECWSHWRLPVVNRTTNSAVTRSIVQVKIICVHIFVKGWSIYVKPKPKRSLAHSTHIVCRQINFTSENAIFQAYTFLSFMQYGRSYA